MIRDVFDSQPKSHNAAWFAGQLNCGRANIYDIFSRASIDTDLLARICTILRHDFFKDLSDSLHD